MENSLLLHFSHKHHATLHLFLYIIMYNLKSWSWSMYLMARNASCSSKPELQDSFVWTSDTFHKSRDEYSLIVRCFIMFLTLTDVFKLRYAFIFFFYGWDLVPAWGISSIIILTIPKSRNNRCENLMKNSLKIWITPGFKKSESNSCCWSFILKVLSKIR